MRRRWITSVNDSWLDAIQCHGVVATARDVDHHSLVTMLHHSIWPIVCRVEWAAMLIAPNMDMWRLSTLLAGSAWTVLGIGSIRATS